MPILPLRCIGSFADLDRGARVGLTAACRDTRPGPADKPLNGRIGPCPSTGDPKGPGVRNGAEDPDPGNGRNLTYGDPGAKLRAPLSSRGQRICSRDPGTPKARLSAARRAHSYANDLMVQSWAHPIGFCRDTELANTGCTYRPLSARRVSVSARALTSTRGRWRAANG
jgi:hypothetical protein